MISRRRTMIRLVALLLFTDATTTKAFVFPSASQRRNVVRSHEIASPISIRFQRAQRQVDTKLPATLAQTMSQLSNPASAFAQLTNSAQATPVIAYFLVLSSAGFGVPVSEDLLCIFAGTMLPLDKIQSPARRIRLIIALYLGVVISDLITFSFGRMMKVGLLEPLRKRMNLSQRSSSKATEELVTVNGSNQDEATTRSRKRDRVIKKLESAGDWAGFYARLSVGFRPAMMILAGFSGKVSFVKYTLGTAFGAVFTLAAQLLLGYSMRHKPSDILAFSSKLLVVAPVALISAMLVYLIRHQGDSKIKSPIVEEDTVEMVDDAVNDTITKAEAHERG